MKKILITGSLIALAGLLGAGAEGAFAQSGVNRQRAQQGNNPVIRPNNPNKQQKIPPAMRKGPLGRFPGVGLPGDNPKPNQQQFRRQQLLQALDLTPDQRARMADIRRKHEEDAIIVGRRLRQARQALDRALFGEQYNEATIKQLTEDLVAAQSEQIRLQARMNTEIRNVMTNEQIRRFRQKERELRREQREKELMNQDDRPPEKNDGDEDLLLWILR